MKQWTKRGVGLLCVMAMLLTVLSAAGFSAFAEEVNPTSIVLQKDTKWKSVYIGGGNLYDTGCGMFSIVNAVGYLTGNKMDVVEVANWGHAIGGYNPGSEASGTYRTTVYPKLEAKYGEQYGFTVDCASGNTGYWSGASSTVLKNHLAAGGVAIGHVPGHFIAVVGYDKSTNYFHVYDSFPTTARGTGTGDAWVTQSALSTNKLNLDWFCLLTRTGTVINGNQANEDTAEKIGTFRISTGELNVRKGPDTSYDAVTTVKNGDIIKVTERSGNWGKFITPDGVEGWASIANYATYIGIDALAYDKNVPWGAVSATPDENGQLVLRNQSDFGAAIDLRLPQQIGTDTTPYLSLCITPNYGSGYYFGVTEYNSAFFMMRDCNSGDELVHESEAPYMTATEALQIDLSEWWKPNTDFHIDTVRIYLAANTGVTVNYLYFAANSGVVTDVTYNLLKQEKAPTYENLMTPTGLSIPDRTKSGSYSYQNGTLTVRSAESSGFDVCMTLNKAVTPVELPNLIYSLDSDVGFDLILTCTTPDGDKTFSLTGDFWPELCEALDGGFIPAGNVSAALDFNSCFVWNKISLPGGETTIKTITVRLGGDGTLVLRALELSDSDGVQLFTDNVSVSDSSSNTSGLVIGDLDGDTEVTTSDCRALMLMLVSGTEFTGQTKTIADFDGNDAVNTIDVRAMLLSMIQTV